MSFSGLCSEVLKVVEGEMPSERARVLVPCCLQHFVADTCSVIRSNFRKEGTGYRGKKKKKGSVAVGSSWSHRICSWETRQVNAGVQLPPFNSVQ